ncbi:MAG TPA: hypothetical protein PLD38_09050 [Pyrinomonadaceae bacterium]|nr:hypothetical protein [Chloracidobacterium sp.]MBP9935697.1 hypothetical protein [Pyrinomonadaceae bacterium]MBK7802649.1 hypothetical protein [Chloracidobacterium sp.]MBK9437499.1 hypothetical protein [Chloracidobacterium sp.]MBL0240170.1 hypothetical protein [Chloracidobacterium sp.]
MKLRTTAVSFVLIVLVAFTAVAQTAEGTSMSDSIWVGFDLDKVMTFYFENGGILSYRNGGKSFRNGKWTQDGKTIKFQMNNGYRVFTGTIHEDTIKGTSSNEAGKEWNLSFYRVDPPNCDPTSFVLAGACKQLSSAKPSRKRVKKGIKKGILKQIRQ